MEMRALALVVALVAVSIASRARPAAADEVAYSCVTAGNVKPTLDHGACTGFEARDAAGHVIQQAKLGFMMSGSLLASADGRVVVALHSSPLVTDHKKFADLEGVAVYRDGKAIARYTTGQLLERRELYTASTSHAQWLVERAAGTLELAGKQLRLTTTSLREVTIDLETGKLAARDSDQWNACDAIVYLGERIPAPVGGVFTIAKPWLAKGTRSTPLKVTAALKVSVTSGKTLCLTPKNEAIANIDVMYNLLPR